jgi:hypothetical protein
MTTQTPEREKREAPARSRDERQADGRADHPPAVIAYRRSYCRGRFSQPTPILHKE